MELWGGRGTDGITVGRSGKGWMVCVDRGTGSEGLLVGQERDGGC